MPFENFESRHVKLIKKIEFNYNLRDFIMRNSESPIDAKDLDKYLKAAIDDEGRLPFDKFVRISTRSISASR